MKLFLLQSSREMLTKRSYCSTSALAREYQCGTLLDDEVSGVDSEKFGGFQERPIR